MHIELISHADRYGALNVQAGTQFCDAEFQAEVSKGKISSSSLDRYCCVALAGKTTNLEMLCFSQGGTARQMSGLAICDCWRWTCLFVLA